MTMQILSALAAVLIGMYVGHKRIGFDFVPDKPDVRIKPTTSEKLLFALNLPTVIVVTLLTYFLNLFSLSSSQFFMEYYYGDIYISHTKG